MGRVLLPLLLALSACASLAPARGPHRHVGRFRNSAEQWARNPENWYDCQDGGGSCPQFWACVPDGCEDVGDPNGPGPGDTDHAGSWEGTPPDR